MKKIQQCRACGSKALSPAFTMSMGAPVNQIWRKSKDDSEFVLCDPSIDARACGLLQSAYEENVVTPMISARHASNRDHLRAVATEALEMISGRDCAALDIGCNDGTLLSYYPRWVERHGVDVSEVANEIGDWAWTACSNFPSPDLEKAFGDKKFDIVTAVSVLEYCDQPKELISAIRDRMTDDGVFVVETLYSPVILTRNAVEAMQSGISAMYSLAVLEWMLRDAGFKVFKGAITGKAGGSIRLFACLQENTEFDFDPWTERLARLWDEENALAMRAVQPYQSFETRMDEVKAATIAQLEEMAGRGEKVHILGADAQTEAMLRWIGPASTVIVAAVDTNESRDRNKLGEKGPRIISETDSRAAEPDCYIAPSRFKRETLERWREAILLGARVMFVTPVPHIVSSMNFSTEYGKAISSGDGPAGTETLRTILSTAGGPRLIVENPARVKEA